MGETSQIADLPRTALSVRQPWAWAIIHGRKDIENRSVAAVRHGMTEGPIAIHAAKGMTQKEYFLASLWMTEIGITTPRPDDLVRGAIIGAVNVKAIVSESSSPWFFGPRGLVLDKARAVDPIPAKGALGYFRWSEGGDLAEPLAWMQKPAPTPGDGLRPAARGGFPDAQPDLFGGRGV